MSIDSSLEPLIKVVRAIEVVVKRNSKWERRSVLWAQITCYGTIKFDWIHILGFNTANIYLDDENSTEEK